MKHIGRKTFGISVGIVVVLLLGVGIVWGASYVADSFTDETKVALKEDVTVHTDVGQVSLTLWECGSAYTDSRDGKVYSTVQIGDQCWMAENMNVGTRINASSNPANNGVIEKYCYSDNETNCDTYGGLYKWSEAMEYAGSCNGTGAPPNDACATPVQGICPDGWHIPSHYEVTTLERAVCDSGTCETDFPYDTSTGGERGTDEGTKLYTGGTSGFEFLMGGQIDDNNNFSSLETTGFFFTSLLTSNNPWRRYMWQTGPVARGYRSGGSWYGHSIRCLQD